MRKLFLLTTFLFTLCSCQRTFHKEDIIGTYYLNISQSKDFIYIYNDNSYSHKFYTSKNDILEIKGEWEIRSSVNEIIFKNFAFFTEKGRDGLPLGNWNSKIEVSPNGKMRLIYSSENNIYYEKK